MVTSVCSCHRFRNVSFEITSIDVGMFEVTGRFLGRQIEKVELVFQVSLTINSTTNAQIFIPVEPSS